MRAELSMPFFIEAGAGPGVVCIHANASNSGQWRPLMGLLSSRFHVLAVDLYGAGKSPPRPVDRPTMLGDEVALLEPVLERAGDPVTVVGHSYGAAVALISAVTQPPRFRALALYEPTLFSLLDAESPTPNDADGIRIVVAEALAALDTGDRDSAAGSFIDYWMGAGAWDAMPEQRKGPIGRSITDIGSWANALFGEPTPLEAFSDVQIPVLYMTGTESPASSRGVARLLTRVLPNVESIELPGLGHMGPLTHPEVVNEAVKNLVEHN